MIFWYFVKDSGHLEDFFFFFGEKFHFEDCILKHENLDKTCGHMWLIVFRHVRLCYDFKAYDWL